MTIPLHKWIQTYPNFPKPGILFYDIAPILENPAFLKQTVETLAAHIDEWSPDLLVGIDSRGFLFATPVALARGLGVVMIRKKRLSWIHRKYANGLSWTSSMDFKAFGMLRAKRRAN